MPRRRSQQQWIRQVPALPPRVSGRPMSAGAPAWRPLDYDRLRIPTAAFEVLAYLTVIAAVVLTVALLTTLIVLSWIHLGQGRHPCFLFLCTLMFFQGGRLLMFTVGAEP